MSEFFPGPGKGGASQAFAFLRDELFARFGITAGHDMAVAMSMVLSAVTGLRVDEQPPLHFLAPSATEKLAAVRKIVQILGKGAAANLNAPKFLPLKVSVTISRLEA